MTDEASSKTDYQCVKRLGIVVVYLLNKEDGGLLDLHLSRIERHTCVPYKIFAAANRLLPKFIPKLVKHPMVEIYEYSATDLRGFMEHGYYLDHLVQTAIDEGVSHVAILNVDSFPISTGWVETMAGHLTDTCLVAAVKRLENNDNKPHPCGIFMHRDFIVKYNAHVNLTESELQSPRCQQYLKDASVIPDTGAGYGYKIYTEGLNWQPLLRSNQAQDHYIISGIYGDLIYHLGGAARNNKIHHPERRQIEERSRNYLFRKVYNSTFLVQRFLPGWAKERFIRLRYALLFPKAKESLDVSENAYKKAREQLLESPDTYIEYLRTGYKTG